MAPSSNNTSPSPSGPTEGDRPPASGPARVYAFLAGLDMRWLYALLFVAVLLPFLFNISVKVKVTGPVQRLYDEIEAIERRPGRLVIVAVDWDPQTQAENYPQTEAVVRHLFMRKIPFAVVASSPVGSGFCEEIPEKLHKKYGAVYGRDWVNWGYKFGRGIFVKQLASDIFAAVKADAEGTPLEDIPMMAGVKDASSVDLVCEITGSVGSLAMWLQYFQVGGAAPKCGHGCTAVSAPESYTFLDSGQLIGLMGGMLGAAEYEQLIESPSRALRGMSSQTTAHILIIMLIVIGNVVEIARKRGGRRDGGEA